MTAFIIPTSADPFSSQKCRFDGRDYILSFAYNQREDRIYMSLADDEGNPIVSGTKMTVSVPLLRWQRFNLAIPPGELMALSSPPDGPPPGLGELGEGKRVQLYYFDAAELAASRFASSSDGSFLPIFVAAVVTPAGGYPGDSTYAIAMRGKCQAAFTRGSIVHTTDVYAAISTIPGAYVSGVAIGTSPPAEGPLTIIPNTISLEANQLPSFVISSLFSS